MLKFSPDTYRSDSRASNYGKIAKFIRILLLLSSVSLDPQSKRCDVYFYKRILKKMRQIYYVIADYAFAPFLGSFN